MTYHNITINQLEKTFNKTESEIKKLYFSGNIRCIYYLLDKWYIADNIEPKECIVNCHADCRGETTNMVLLLNDGNLITGLTESQMHNGSEKLVKITVYVFDTGARVVINSKICDKNEI